jgi:hypothetical protein
MKLNPPASSSDLEVARAIAQRLHQRRRGTDVAPLSAFEPPPAPSFPGRPPVEVPPPVWSVEPPPLPKPLARKAEPPPPPLPEPIDPLAGLGETPEPVPAAPGLSAEDLLAGRDEPPAAGPVEAAGSGPDLPEAEPLPPPFDEPARTPDEGPEDLFAAAPPPPSWDEIVENCLALSRAHGAMLVDAAGQVVSARGEWPEPGPDLIAGKLVAMMDRTLRDAPTRSVSAPLAGRQLTAWRVPLPEGLVTIAFIGNAPVRTDSRPAIDAEIHRGAGG